MYARTPRPNQIDLAMVVRTANEKARQRDREKEKEIEPSTA